MGRRVELANVARRKTRSGDPEQMNRKVPAGKTHARGFNTEQGFPAAKTSGGMSLVTTEQAPMTLRAPITTPGMMKARAPTNASSPMVIFAVTN